VIPPLLFKVTGIVIVSPAAPEPIPADNSGELSARTAIGAENEPITKIKTKRKLRIALSLLCLK
jgi:hypothetical protein